MSLLHRFRRDERGNSLIEFAILCQVLLAVLMGLGDLAYQGYMEDVLTGAVQKAGRDSTLQYASTKLTDIDNAVKMPVLAVSPNAQFTSTRQSFSTFTQAAPEPFTDTAGTGIFDSKKDCFTDINGNGVWDANPVGATGQGGASDVTVYTMTVTYSRLFPIAQLAGLGDSATISANTILKNQPYAGQAVATQPPAATVCPKP